IEGIVKAMSQKLPTEEEKAKVPLRPAGSYGKISKVSFSPIMGETPRPLAELTSKETGAWHDLKVPIEVVFGKTRLTLKELTALEIGSLLPLDELCDDLVDIYASGARIARGEIVAVDGQFGVKIISFTKN